MKNIKYVLVLFVAIFFITGCGKDEKEQYMQGKVNIEMTIQQYGVIELELDADVAPITVTNFVNLVKDQFYDGLTFHRIINGFMIQGGDPTGTGEGGSRMNIQGEFSSNGIENSISHTRGTISMARNGYNYNSASSQFFIVQQDSTYLDGDYAAFGHVISGMEVVDAIAENTKVEDENGTVLEKNQPVIEKIRLKKNT